jgi:O-antigen/teichoic acid export membrane protein
MRGDTTWAFAGNAVFAACQWFVLVILVQALPQAEVGQFAYALAVTAPIFLLANVRLRSLLAAGVPSPGDFRDYLATRLLTTTGAAGVSVGIAAVSSNTATVAVVAVVALGRVFDAISEVCHGLLQRERDMRSASIGLMVNGIVSVVLVQTAVTVGYSLLPAALAYAAGSGAALLGWDVRCAAKALQAAPPHPDAPVRWASVCTLFVRALPLGISSAVGSLQTNLPRYVIASTLGPVPLAVFAAVSHLPLVGHLVINAASQAALPVLARDARTSSRSYHARLRVLAASALMFGILALVVAAVAGRLVLCAIYGAPYAEHAPVLVWLTAGTVLTFTAVILGTGTTARGRFGAQLSITTLSFLAVAGAVGPLISRFGLNGAAGALLVGAIVELSAYAALTRRDMRRAAPGPAFLSSALADGVRS